MSRWRAEYFWFGVMVVGAILMVMLPSEPGSPAIVQAIIAGLAILGGFVGVTITGGWRDRRR